MTKYIGNLLQNIATSGGLEKVFNKFGAGCKGDFSSGKTDFLSYMKTYIRTQHVDNMKGSTLGQIMEEMSVRDCGFSGRYLSSHICGSEPIDALRDIVTAILGLAILKLLEERASKQ